MQITSVNTFKWYSSLHCKLHVVPVQYHEHEFFKPQGILQLNSRFWPNNMYKNVQTIMKQAENWTNPPTDEHTVLRKNWCRIKQKLVINISLADSKLSIKMKNISCHNSVHKWLILLLLSTNILTRYGFFFFGSDCDKKMDNKKIILNMN